MRASQLRFSSQTEQTLSTCVLILSSFLKRLDVFMHTLDSKFRYMITIIIVAQNDPIHHQAGIQSGSLVFSPRRTCPEPSPSSPSWFWTSTSTTPMYKTADFLFFDDREDVKKTDNNVVKGKGCLIHVHEDNLPPFPLQVQVHGHHHHCSPK